MMDYSAIVAITVNLPNGETVEVPARYYDSRVAIDTFIAFVIESALMLRGTAPTSLLVTMTQVEPRQDVDAHSSQTVRDLFDDRTG